eukprot:TRINITY_DN15676_c0_g1_i1.p1 TRINITY_DN15676_c0_g1~~TRINITY_DN15676_c0_g1_i1.p1  ORF type:complete len:211 (+),score=2.45 TRINITY_DN15676_c0_g1_i1:74-706(+)
MAKRSLKGHVAHISTTFLRFLNLIIVAGGLGLIVIIFVLEGSPSFPAGWGFVTLGLLTAISGLFGAVSSGQLGCFGCHLFCLLVSAIGLCGSFIIIFLRLNTVLGNMHPKHSVVTSKQLLRIEGAVCFVLFCSQLVVLLLACLIQSCGFIEFYEDLDANKSAKEIAKMHQEDELKRAKLEGSTAHRLAEKMKKKYGQWARESDYDVENQG